MGTIETRKNIDLSPSAWLLNKANSQEDLPKYTLRVIGTGAAAVEFSGRVLAGTAITVFNALDRVSRAK